MSEEQVGIRAATARDAVAISAVIVEALQVSNAPDYPPDVIERVSRNFSPEAVVRMILERRVVVATEDERVVGTASLGGAEIRSVFVLPDRQGLRIGARMSAELLQAACEMGLTSVIVQSTVTALGFYDRLGFRAVREHWHGDERTVIMERPL